MSDIKKRLDLLRNKRHRPAGDLAGTATQRTTPHDAASSDSASPDAASPDAASPDAASSDAISSDTAHNGTSSGTASRQKTLDRLRSMISGVQHRRTHPEPEATDSEPHTEMQADVGMMTDTETGCGARKRRAWSRGIVMSARDDGGFASAGLLTPAMFEGPGQSIDDLIPGEYIDTPCGPCFRVRTEYPWHHYQGNMAVSSLLDMDPGPLESLTGDAELGRLDYQQTLFFDTETTGLDTGAGVYIFLAGAGYFSNRRFILEQYFMRDFPEEPAVLHALSDLMSRFRYIVTYNGKTYDWPLLESRYAMNRRKPPLDRPPHLDLLHGARKLFKHRLENCRLPSVEAGVIGFQRVDDLPGALLPERYFQYVRSRDARFIHQAFAHNAHDIVSMAAILAAILEFLHHPLAPGCFPTEDIYSFARLREAAGDTAGAIEAYTEALKRGLNPDLYPAALLHLSMAHKRCTQWDQACRIWKAMIQSAPETGVLPYVELAKYYEHQVRDYDESKEWVQKALQLTSTSYPFNRSVPDELRHRIARLEAKARGETWHSPSEE